MAKLSPPVLPALDACNLSDKKHRREHDLPAHGARARRSGLGKAGVYLRGYGGLSSQGRSGKVDCRYIPMAPYLVRIIEPMPSSASSTPWTVAWNHQSRRERGHHKRIILTVQPA